MKPHKFLATITMALMSFAAQANIYTYQGNAFFVNDFGTTPIVATFDFDFAHSSQSANDIYEFKRWDVQSGSIHISSANGDRLRSRFSFDASRNITGWYFSASSEVNDAYFWNIQSISTDYSDQAPNVAQDIVSIVDWFNPLRSAANYDYQGTWTHLPTVPEPSSLLLLAAGGIACAGMRRRDKRNAA